MIEQIKKAILPYQKETFKKKDFYRIINQGFEGYIEQGDIPKDFYEEILQRNKNTTIRNIIYLNWVDEFSRTAERNEWKVIFLKGIVLLEDIYEELQQRTLGDIDILLDQETFLIVENFLIADGFKKISEKKWKGNNFKSNLVKKINGIEIVVELHSKLFMNESDIHWKSIPFKNKYSRRLSPTDELMHLMSHLAFQHTFLKIHWLIDIAFYLRKYKDELDIQRFKELNQKLGHLNSTYSVSTALSNFDIEFKVPKTDYIRRFILKKLNTIQFLCSPRDNKINYFIIKHATKSSWYDSIKYDILWLCYQVKQLKKRKY